MAFVIDTVDEDGNPKCPMCASPVELEGQFCGPACYQEFHVVVFDIGEPVEMTYLPLHEQSWYGKEGL